MHLPRGEEPASSKILAVSRAISRPRNRPTALSADPGLDVHHLADAACCRAVVGDAPAVRADGHGRGVRSGGICAAGSGGWCSGCLSSRRSGSALTSPACCWVCAATASPRRLLGFAVMCLMFTIIRREVSGADEITLDVIAQALVRYLIIGIAWIAIYAVANLIDGKIFASSLQNDQNGKLRIFQLIDLDVAWLRRHHPGRSAHPHDGSDRDDPRHFLQLDRDRSACFALPS
jgi:hypothetical protein